MGEWWALVRIVPLGDAVSLFSTQQENHEQSSSSDSDGEQPLSFLADSMH